MQTEDVNAVNSEETTTAATTTEPATETTAAEPTGEPADEPQDKQADFEKEVSRLAKQFPDIIKRQNDFMEAQKANLEIQNDLLQRLIKRGKQF